MSKKTLTESEKAVVSVSRDVALLAVLFVAAAVVLVAVFFDVRETGSPVAKATVTEAKAPAAGISDATILRPIPADAWKAPDESTIPPGKDGEMIRYGRDLLAHTAKYFGPRGSIAQISNGMNCQNCHLDAGGKLFGNNYAGFISDYPRMNARSGKVVPATVRIADCFERSLAGEVPDTSGKEVQAMLAYMKWIGKDVKKGQKLFGKATEKLAFMDHAADAVKGKEIFVAKCQSCHGASGEGVLAGDKKVYVYPPLWGKHSYNDGAGMYRLANFAGFVKNNMPFGATYKNPQLTDEEAWNVAAFVNSQPRLHKDQHKDWIDLSKKPVDAPFGPYIDKFTEKQHKFGPFKPILDAQKNAMINKQL